VTEYSIVTKNYDHFQQYFGEILNYVHPKSSKFLECDIEIELSAGLQNEEVRLNSEYKTLMDLFEKIQGEMK